MPPKIQNRLKSGLWILLPLILLSFISSTIADNPLPVDEGRYVLSADALSPRELEGDVTFAEQEVVSSTGHLLNVLKIQFQESENDQGFNMEFMISLRSDSEPIGEGKYYLNRYISGFVSEFNGVFGYADLNEQGEEPYFSKSGHLRITNRSDHQVQGTMEVTLVDVDGNKLQLGGSFKALRQ